MKKISALLISTFFSLTFSAILSGQELSNDNYPSQCEGLQSTSQRLSEEKFITVGNILQWITIKGESCSNPVILFLHGGPGNPESIYADSVYGVWEDTFTIVHWDQRGAGKTYGKNPEPSELNIELMVQDGIEVVEYLFSYLNKEKIILAGNSWGSILAVYMAQKKPEYFYAYVGTAQAGLDVDNIYSYNKTLAVARSGSNFEAVKTLESLGSPPWKNPRNFGILRRVQRPIEAAVTDPWPSTWVVSSSYASPEYRKSYIAGEDFSYIQYIGMNGDGFAKDIDLASLGYRFEIPVYLIQGEEDLVTIAELSKQYFDKINAPDKEYLLLPNTGHGPNEHSHEANYKILVDKVLPLVK